MSDAIASPSGSEAVTGTVSRLPACTVAVAGAVTAGAWSALVTVIAVVAEPERAFAAAKVTLYGAGRAFPPAGVQVKLPEVCGEGEEN